MTIRNAQQTSTWPDGTLKVLSTVSIDTDNSPKVNGKLRLRSNRASIDKMRLVNAEWTLGSGMSKPPDGRNGGIGGFSFSNLDNIAYNRWRGKLFKGSASLGVTAASWHQSRDMIVSRTNSLRRTLDSTIGYLEKNPNAVKRLKREREPLANQVLETEFGWRPLFADIHAALFTVCKDGQPPEWVGGVGRGYVDINVGSTSNPYYFHTETYVGQARTSYSTKVQIANPNLWLLNRLGLINPATVVWDIIPWSFVVNMFLNVNSILNSFTDTVGLNVTDMSITRTCKLMHDYALSNKPSGSGLTTSSTNIYYKRRTLGTPLKPTLELRIPELNWELCLIASSLVVQKFRRINNIIRLV